MITKGAITEGAALFMVIWSVTSTLTPKEQVIMLSILDDYALELESDGLLMGYHTPGEYGCSDANDDSGLADWMAGPMKKLLAIQALTVFGRPATIELAGISKSAMASLEHALVNVGPACNPSTLPKGSGNECAYRDNKFYSEQPRSLSTETDGDIDDITLNTESQNYYP